MAKPRIAVFDFACCEGCQLQLVNMEEEILDLLAVADVVEWREAISEQSDEYDIAVIEGSITRLQDAERLKQIRSKASILVALGACAVSGGVNRLKNQFSMEDVRKEVYGSDAGQSQLATDPVQSVAEVVKVDYNILGCPVDKKELVYVLKSLAIGRVPQIPSYAVCLECKIKENTCQWALGEVCLGPLTRAGCDARCTSFGQPCIGCRGFAEGANPEGMAAILDLYGKKREDMESRMKVFLNPAGKEVTHA